MVTLQYWQKCIFHCSDFLLPFITTTHLLLLTPLILFILVVDTYTERKASVSDYEAFILVIWNYFISYIMKMNPLPESWAQHMGRLQFIRHLPYLKLMPHNLHVSWMITAASTWLTSGLSCLLPPIFHRSVGAGLPVASQWNSTGLPSCTSKYRGRIVTWGAVWVGPKKPSCCEIMHIKS